MKKFWKKVLASSLAFICTVTAGVAAVATNGFGLFNAAQVEGVEHNKQLSFGNFFGNGIMLTASAAESTAVTLTHGNDYNSAYLDAKNRACIQPYGITIPSGVTLTAKTGYQFGFYSLSNISTPTTASMLGGGWIDTFTTTSNGTYGIAVKKVDDSDFNFSTDSIYVADYIDSTDSSIFGSSGSTPSTPSVPTGAQRLTAIVTPANAYISGIDWSLSFANPSSTWASGKTVTDYVTVTPTANGVLTADVECKQAFGEQIIITATSKDNEELTAQCTLDYSKRFEGISATLMCTRVLTGVMVPMINTYVFGKGGVTPINVTKPSGFATYSNEWATNYTWGTGTIEETVSESFTLNISDGLRAAMVAQGLNINFEPIPINENTGLLFDTKNLETFFGIAPNSSNYGLLTNAFANNTSDFDFVINYKISTAHHSQTLQSKVKINPDSLIEVTGLALSLTNHIF